MKEIISALCRMTDGFLYTSHTSDLADCGKEFLHFHLFSPLRCSNCFDCPCCGHTLTTRATSQMVSNPDDPGKSTPKKMYYLACGFCRWTTRDVGIADKPIGKCCIFL